VRLARVAGEDQAAGARSEMACHGRCVRLGCASANGVVTAAIEKESKGSGQVRQREHIGNQELRLNGSGRSAALRLLDCQRRKVDSGYVKTLLR
jgi:hypothetical protein